MRDFFVSYTGADQQWAEWIAWELENAGYSIVIQVWDFRPGSNFVLEMQRAATECARTIAVLSPNYLSALFTQPEWAAAFAQDPTGAKGTLIPVRVRECELRGLLTAINYIDLVDADETTTRQRLLDGVKHERAKPTTAPKFPLESGERAARPTRFPGTPPSIWNVPFLRNPNFTGRADLLQQLRAALSSGQTTALTQAQAIHGMGGIGKTQLAVEYAYRFAADYDIVWFVRAESTSVLAGDLALLANPLQLAERDERDQNVVVQAVRNALLHRDRWLIIFDNAEDPKDVRAFLPQGNGHTLITSRNPNWSATAHALDVQVMQPQDAVEFLLKRIGAPSPLPSPVDGRGSDAEKLAHDLGYLPLALEQAGAYIEASGKTLAEYLQLYRTHQRDLLKRPPATDYPATVATTWEISFQAIAAQSPASVALLNLLAFFAPDAIPRDVIVAGAKRLPEPLQTTVRDEMKLDEAVMLLRRYSLVQGGDRMFAVHRLVQQVVRDRMTDDECKKFAEAALHCINDASPTETYDVRNWPIFVRLYAHARTTVDETERLNLAPESTGRLLNVLALYQKSRAEFIEAKALLERALKICESSLGANHRYVASTVNNLGSVLQDLGDLHGAKQCYERALTIDEAILGKEHPNVAIRVNNLGMVLQDLGDLHGAKACFERALTIDEATFGKDHPNVARDVNNLGGVLRDLGDLNGAKACFERALKILTQFLPADHPNIKTVRENLSILEEEMRGNAIR